MSLFLAKLGWDFEHVEIRIIIQHGLKMKHIA